MATTGDIETYRHHRRMRASPVTINHDLKLLRKMFAWGIRERVLVSTPFKVGSENVIRLDPESPREERPTSEAAERKLRGVNTTGRTNCVMPGGTRGSVR